MVNGIVCAHCLKDLLLPCWQVLYLDGAREHIYPLCKPCAEKEFEVTNRDAYLAHLSADDLMLIDLEVSMAGYVGLPYSDTLDVRLK